MSDHRRGVTLALFADEALVLFDCLARTSDASEPVPFADQAEQGVLRGLECKFERVLLEPFSPGYATLLGAARRAIRDDAYE